MPEYEAIIGLETHIQLNTNSKIFCPCKADSWDDRPLARGGSLYLPMPGYTRRVSIHKLHMEEDAGKTKNLNGYRLIDFNRCGVPLVERVNCPDLRSADNAARN